MNYKIRLIIALTLVIIYSCHGQNTKHPNKCIELNDEGTNYLMNYPLNGEKGLDTAIGLFKQAIMCDSTNVIFYNNLANAYDQKHEYDSEMTLINKMLILTKNDPAILLQKGMLNEVIGHIDSAKNIYHTTQLLYEKRIVEQPNNINLIKGLILSIAVANGKDEAIKTLNKKIEIYPKFSAELSNELSFYKDFNRHDYVYRLPTVTNLQK